MPLRCLDINIKLLQGIISNVLCVLILPNLQHMTNINSDIKQVNKTIPPNSLRYNEKG